MTKTFDDFLKGGVDQIAFPENGEVNFIYLGQEIVETRHGDRVKITVFDLAEQRETAIFTLAKGLIKPLFIELKVQMNDKVWLKRTGDGFNTKYDVRIIERANPDGSQAVTANSDANAKNPELKPPDEAPFP